MELHMNPKAQIVSVNISQEKGTVKQPVERVDINRLGIVGDAHAAQIQIHDVNTAIILDGVVVVGLCFSIAHAASLNVPTL